MATVGRLTPCPLLQRSRGLSTAETGAWSLRCQRANCASTEPRSFDRGNPARWPRSCRASALQRSRGLSTAETARHLWPVFFRLIASTEPRSFDRGNELNLIDRLAFIEASTEPRSFDRGNNARNRESNLARARFNGAAVFRPRKRGAAMDGSSPKIGLQRSRGLSTAETECACTAEGGRVVASTEPRSFDRGNAVQASRGDRPGEAASTEPRSFDRGNPR